MAARDLSKTFDEFESEDLSGFETSVPTDLTLSPDRTDRHERNRNSKITKQLIERKQLSHDLQLVRIELSQKNLQVENMKAEYLQRVDDLDEKLNDERHQKQILQARLESQLTIQQEEARRRQELIKQELDEVRQKQRQLEATNERLQERAGNVRRTLRDLDLTEDKFYELRTTTEDDLSLRDYVAMRLFEKTKPLETEVEQLRMKVKSLEDTDRSQSKQMLKLQEELEEERQSHGEIRVKYQKLALAHADTKNQVKTDNYKVENYDRIKGERDNLEKDDLDVHRQLSTLEAAHQNVCKERDELRRELSAAKQSLTLLKQDKDYLTRQSADVANRLQFAEEKMVQINLQLDDAKRSREDMYEKYVSSREQYKSEYENKLRDELEQIRVRTNSEIDRLRTSSKEMYERENRNLREARDMSISEKERALITERETNTKYEQLLQEWRQLQVSGDSRVSDLANDLKLKTFELERTQLVLEETVKNQKETQLEVEKLTKKAEVLTKEYYVQQTGLEKRIAELESQLQEKEGRLQTYERMEKELDDVVMQAAEVDNEEEAEKVLFSYGYGANVPSTAKRRLQQSVHLARRVLQLEKINTSLKQEVNREKKKILQLADEVKSTNSLLDQSQQPYNYLIDSMRTRDTQISKQKDYISQLEEENQRLGEERGEAVKVKNQMALDLERLLNQREEMSVMKQVVLSMSTRVPGEKKAQHREHLKPKSASMHVPNRSFETYDEPNISKPGSISLTRSSPPKWAKKLKNKNMSQSTNYSKVYATSTS
ncbi:progesterone-induced-blocking factor 1-like [Mya arenaria]|uniref:progesterone-induced-blocking factor 1-like n=1 Tax=Mya arenaria TaxID=6604 RepID=UPI0022E84957|nr:progesterone-induced-blocking factor 1-like [Mya arenaria]